MCFTAMSSWESCISKWGLQQQRNGTFLNILNIFNGTLKKTLHQNLFASILANRVAVYKGRVLTPAQATQYSVAAQVSWTLSVNGKNIQNRAFLLE